MMRTDSQKNSRQVQKKRINTSWEVTAKEYSKLVGVKGSYYHQQVIFPQLLLAMDLKPKDSVLELGCGQGVFSRVLDPQTTYLGLDASPSLIKFANTLKGPRAATYKHQDVTQPFTLSGQKFTHVVIILALQNMADLNTVIANAAAHLHPHGRIWIVMNHPSFRIPQHSSWQINAQNDTQSRLVDTYMSPLKIAIDMNPGNPNADKTTWSFHHPLSTYIQVAKRHKLGVENLQEWVSNKQSVGKNAARENKAREEIPMFLMLTLSLW